MSFLSLLHHMESLDPTSSRDDSLEATLAFPEYAQNLLPEIELPTLVLISHGHSPPLNPTPDLKFDVRSIPNPPKHIRDAYNGTSKRLQGWMQSDERFIAKRDAIRKEIEEAMTEMTTVPREVDVLKPGTQQREHLDEDPSQPIDKEVITKNFFRDEEESKSGSDFDDRDISRDDLKTLRVGMFCAMGRHRSVAMVEELSRLPWAGWRVEVKHRDIDKKRGAARAEKKGKGSRGTRGGTVLTDEKSE